MKDDRTGLAGGVVSAPRLATDLAQSTTAGPESIAPQRGSGMSHETLRSFEPLLDDERAAQFLGGIHPKTLQRLARNGYIPAYRIGKFWRYRASELDEWLRLQSTIRIARVVSTKEKP